MGGERPYHRVELSATLPLHTLLSHLYVLIPVLDGDKHYWVGDDEVEKLLRHGEGWLVAHPERELIARRYLKHRRSLVDDAIERLSESAPDPCDSCDSCDASETPIEATLHEQRLSAVFTALKASGATSALDLGCGEGKLLRLLLGEKQFTRITGMDVSYRALEIAADRLGLERLAPKQR